MIRLRKENADALLSIFQNRNTDYWFRGEVIRVAADFEDAENGYCNLYNDVMSNNIIYLRVIIYNV